MMLSNSILITICCKAFALNIECVNIIFEPRTHHFEKVDLVSYTVTAGVFRCHNEFPQKKLDLTSLQKGSGTFLFLFCDASYNLFVIFFIMLSIMVYAYTTYVKTRLEMEPQKCHVMET